MADYNVGDNARVRRKYEIRTGNLWQKQTSVTLDDDQHYVARITVQDHVDSSNSASVSLLDHGPCLSFLCSAVQMGSGRILPDGLQPVDALQSHERLFWYHKTPILTK